MVIQAAREDARRVGDVPHRGGAQAALGDPAEVVPRVAREVGATSVHVSRENEPGGVERDRRVVAALREMRRVTKPSGLVAVRDADYAAMVHTTTQLNRPGTVLAQIDGVHALTDVTGFGVLGHTLELARGAEMTACIDSHLVPLLPGVRALAEQHDLVTARKKDSTGICFIGERRFRDFLQQYLPAQPGTIETPEGDVIGQHMGLMYYTLGQRQGLGIGGLANYPEDPWYVAGKDLTRNVLIAVQGKQHALLYTNALATEAMDWVASEPPAQQGRFTAKTRYRQSDCPCEIRAQADGSVEVIFDDPQWAVTPGQSLVLYDNDICLGGGVIRATWNTTEAAA